MNTDKQEHHRFNVARLQAKFEGAYTDEEIENRRNELVASGNVYAKKAAKEKRVSEDIRANFQRNQFWERLESEHMVDIASVPRPTPSKQDQHGLWKPENKKCKHWSCMH